MSVVKCLWAEFYRRSQRKTSKKSQQRQGYSDRGGLDSIPSLIAMVASIQGRMLATAILACWPEASPDCLATRKEAPTPISPEYADACAYGCDPVQAHGLLSSVEPQWHCFSRA